MGGDNRIDHLQRVPNGTEQHREIQVFTIVTLVLIQLVKGILPHIFIGRIGIIDSPNVCSPV